ncbi:MAG: anaerobic ribonucleoside-triphosphate reductase activating protein [Candidatus Diapherotrites archaeon]
MRKNDEGYFAGMQKLSLIDYPGLVACTLFVSGCNFRCPFCQNPTLALGLEKNRISKKEVLSLLKKRAGLMEGVCISGGEPAIHEWLLDFLKDVKNLGYRIKIDTNGSKPEFLLKLINKKIVDYIAMDIKAPLDKYDLAAGVAVDIEAVKKSIAILLERKVDYEFRTTVVPTIIDLGDIEKICKSIKGAEKYFVQQFVNTVPLLDKRMEKVQPYPKDILEEMASIARKYVKKVEIRSA